LALEALFIKASDPRGLVAWYEKHLGISFKGTTYTDWPFIPTDGSQRPGSNVLSFVKNDSDYFAPGEKPVMLIFFVHDLLAFLAMLKEGSHYYWRADG